MIKIYKLRYENKQQAIDDLLNKGVYTTYEDTLVNSDMIEAVVELGEITMQNPEDLSIFITTSNMEVLTQDQLDIINNL